MKKILSLTFLFFLLFIFSKSNAQEKGAIHVAVIPFTPSTPDAVAEANHVESEVSSCFVNKSRFYLLDRGQTDKLKKELDAAKDNSSLYAKRVTEDGRLAGAAYIITGTVDKMEIGETQISTGSVFKKATGSATTTTQYHGVLHLTLEIISVETGRVVLSEPIIATSDNIDNRSEALMEVNALCKLKDAVLEKVRGFFPPTIIIVRVEAEKKGLPEKVLVNAGSEVFDNGRTTSTCSGEPATSSWLSKKLASKLRLSIIKSEDIKVGDRVLKHETVVGELKIMSIEGDLALCTVEEGAQLIKDSMASGAPILVRLKKD